MNKKEELEIKIVEPHKCFLYVGEVICYQEPTPENCEKCRNQFWEM